MEKSKKEQEGPEAVAQSKSGCSGTPTASPTICASAPCARAWVWPRTP